MLGARGLVHGIRPLNQLLAQGCQVLYVDSVNPYPQGREGYSFLLYPTASKCIDRKIGAWAGKLVAQGVIIPYLRWAARRFKTDVIHVHWVDCNAVYAEQVGGTPVVVSVLGSDVNNCFLPGAKEGDRQWVAQALRGAQSVIIDAPWMKARCEQVAGQALHTELAHLGVDTDLFRPGYAQEAVAWREKWQVEQNATLFLSARALDELYQHELILHAFAKVNQVLEQPTYLIFKVYNQVDSAYRQRLEAEIVRLQLQDHVRWVEQVPPQRLPEIYAAVDFVVNVPSRDTFPVTFLEAAACEKPVISILLDSYKGTFAEQVFKLDSNMDAMRLAELMLEAYEDGRNHRFLLEEARQIVVHQFNEQEYITHLLKIYKDLQTCLF